MSTSLLLSCAVILIILIKIFDNVCIAQAAFTVTDSSVKITSVFLGIICSCSITET